MLSRNADQLWHVWINQRQDARRKAGEKWESSLYAFKGMLQSLGWFQVVLKQAFTGTLPKHESRCNICEPEGHDVPDNKATCALGVNVVECPILKSLRDSFNEQRTRTRPDGRPSFYADVPDDDLYATMAATCAWHLFTDGRFVDWNEGAIQTTGDRMFWQRVYDNLVSDPK